VACSAACITKVESATEQDSGLRPGLVFHVTAAESLSLTAHGVTPTAVEGHILHAQGVINYSTGVQPADAAVNLYTA